MDNDSFVVLVSPKLLGKLRPDTTPLWGKMPPQKMVEHLSLRFAYSSKKVVEKEFMPRERMAFYKASFFNKDKPIPRNFTAKGLMPKLKPIRYGSLEEAIAIYQKSAKEFDEFFKRDPLALTFHPFFGFLSYQEWLTYHARHIKHHFFQFGLIESIESPWSSINEAE